MSYVEKAFYKYVKNILTSGLRVLFSKKYIVYTVAFILISITTTVFYLIRKYTTNLIPEVVAEVLISIELSMAITYIIFGLFFSKYPFKYWVPPAFIVTAGGAVMFFFLPQISPYVAAISYLCWIVVSVFLTFSLSRNFWGGKVLGSIMFLGKKADEGTIVFSGVVFFFTLINTAMAGYVTYDTIRRFIISGYSSESLTSFVFMLVTIFFAIIAIIIVNIIIFALGKTDDVFYTILAFFYVFSSFTLWKLAIYTFRYRDSTKIIPYDNIGSIIVALFLILYSVSNYAKKVKRIEKRLDIEVILEEVKPKKRKAIEEFEVEKEWGMLKIPGFMGPLGVLMTIMGLILGYHVTILQFIATEDFFTQTFFSLSDLVGLKDKFAIILIPLLIIYFLFTYRWSERFRNYASPELYRFEFLPPFEELEERLERIKRGEDSWKTYANMVLKEGVKFGMKSAATKVFVSPTKKVAGAIGGAYTKTKSGIGKIFRRKKKADENLEEGDE